MPSSDQTPAVIFIGSPTRDTVIRAGRAHEVIGGAAFISALAACWAGAKTGIVARVPPLLPAMASAVFGPGGLHRGGLKLADGALPSFRIQYDEDDRAQYTQMKLGMESNLVAEDIPAHWMTSSAKWLHIAGIGASSKQQLIFLDALKRLYPTWMGRISIGTCRAMIESDIESTHSLLNSADVFFLNQEEFDLLCPDGLPEGTDTTVVITQGPDGVQVLGGPHCGHHPSIPAPVVDPTGAGDSLCGGFIGATVTDRQEPVKIGVRAASNVLEGLGASPLSSWVAAQIQRRADHNTSRLDTIAPLIAASGQSAAFSFADPPHLEAGHPLALSMLCIATLHQYGFWTGDPTQGWQGPMYAELDGHRYKGSDFIWAAFARAARETPDMLSLERMTKDRHLFATICTADNGQCPIPDLESHQALHMAHAFAMMREWPEGYSPLVDHANRSDRPVATLLKSLSSLPGYMSDPLAKKANLLAIILSARPERFIDRRDPESLDPIVDYHMMRLCLRTGVVRVDDPDLARRLAQRTWVDMQEELAIRQATGRAILGLVERTGCTVGEIDGLFFKLGRSLCLEGETPHCERCPLQAECAQKTELFQPIYRTTAY